MINEQSSKRPEQLHSKRPTLKMFMTLNPEIRKEALENIVAISAGMHCGGVCKGLAYGLGVSAAWSLVSGQVVRGILEATAATVSGLMAKPIRNKGIICLTQFTEDSENIPDTKSIMKRVDKANDAFNFS